MELCVNDQVTADPSADDIRDALDAVPHAGDWSLVLDAGDGSYLEASVRPDGSYEVDGCDGQSNLELEAPLGSAELKALLLKYLARDASWREACPWDAIGIGHTAPPARSGPPPWALGVVVATIAFVVLAFLILQVIDNSWLAALPFGDSDYFWVGLIALPFVVVLVVAVLAKMLEVRQAAAWSTTSGRIVKSATTAERQGFADGTTTVKTMPAVEYEFSVGGTKWRGNRISIGEDSGGANTEATLRRYPVGAVVKVHYDPGDPKKSVLERDIPEGVGRGLLAIVAFVAVVVGVIYWLATAAPAFLRKQFPDAEPVTIFAACFGLLVLLFFLASWRRARQAADWPMVRGTVLSSGCEKIGYAADGRRRNTYAPAVEYRYRVNDVDYVGRQIKLGVVVASSQSYAEKVAARYPEGSVVDVHYNPANPSAAALENPTAFHWLLLAVASGCFAIAAYTAGVFR